MSDYGLGTALITGASSGIGAIYADRLARRGYDLVLVARDKARMAVLAERLTAETGVAIDLLPADLTNAADLRTVEARLRDDDRIVLLVNNAGAAGPAGFVGQDLDVQERLISLNVTAVTRLAGAVMPRFVAAGNGSVINLTSVLAVAPEIFPGLYPATKAFVLAFSQSLQSEVGNRGVYVQAVLPSATRTEIWQRSGRDAAAIANLMEAEELVDAALIGFDRREAITIPSLPDIGQWDAFTAARKAMLPNFRQVHAASRYHA